MKHPPHKFPLDVRFWKKVKRSADATRCWDWTGAISNAGYGVINRGRSGLGNILAHRLSYQMHYGEIPAGMFVCHKCDNPPCTNPNHLFLGTQADNMADCVAKGRTVVPWNARENSLKTHCKSGHPFSPENTYVGADGYRYCKECKRISKRKMRARERAENAGVRQ